MKSITALHRHNLRGHFVRGEAYFRHRITDNDPIYQPEKGRYHLYVSYACPWASRTLILLHMKGLQESIGVSVVHPTWQKTNPDDPEDDHKGWVFRKPTDPPLKNTKGYGSIPCDGCIDDNVNNAQTIRDLYEMCLPEDSTTTYSVPVLWDKKTKTIVNNESSEICEILNSSFQALAKHPEVDLFPQELKKEIDEANNWIHDDINNGVYKCGFAKSQEAYETAFLNLFSALDKVEHILSKQSFIVGDRLKITDVRLFVTLIRFDEVYFVYFKTNKKSMTQYPNIMRYLRDLYKIEAIRNTTHMDHIKRHYYTSHEILNPYAIIPVGADFLGVLENYSK